MGRDVASGVLGGVTEMVAMGVGRVAGVAVEKVAPFIKRFPVIL